jgi:hypothetical protein
MAHEHSQGPPGAPPHGESLPTLTRPDVHPIAPDLVAVEDVMRRAIDERRPDLLSIVGKGELSIAIRWGAGDATCVVKRVPPFPTRHSADAYCDLVREHLADLARLDVRAVTTDLYTLDRSDGSAVVYHCQPLLDADQLADHVLERTPPEPQHPLMVAVLDAIVLGNANRVPIDGQFANWYWFEGEPWQLDFSTPLMLDERGNVRFDVTGFLREYPAPVRRTVYKELMKIAAGFGDPVWALEDVLVQLHREHMTQWCVPFAQAARDRHGFEISSEVAEQRCKADTKFFPTLLRLKRFQRAWMQRTGRRYDTLLPATTSYDE